MNIHFRVPSIVLVGVLIFCLGCRATAAPDAGFLDHPELLKESKSVPFNVVWAKEGFSPTQYETITVEPVDTSHLLSMSWWDRASFANNSNDSNAKIEVKKLAQYFSDRVIEELGKISGPPHYSKTSKGKTLALELALVEVIPTKVWLNTVGYVFTGALDHGAVAMEGRFRDVQSGEIMARWKDRQYGQSSLVSVADLGWYTHAFHTLDYWSEILARLGHTPFSQKIEGRDSVTLKAW